MIKYTMGGWHTAPPAFAESGRVSLGWPITLAIDDGQGEWSPGQFRYFCWGSVIWHSPLEMSSQFSSAQFSSLTAELSFGSCSGVGRSGEVLVYETPRMSAPFLHMLHLYREGQNCVIFPPLIMQLSLWWWVSGYSPRITLTVFIALPCMLTHFLW